MDDSARPSPRTELFGTKEIGGTRGKKFMPLFLQCQRRMYSFAYTLVLNRADADDVFQDASVVMWEKFDSDMTPDEFTAWGNRIIYFKALEFRRSRRDNRVVFSQSVFERVAETALEQANCPRAAERVDALERCLERLPSDDRNLLVRRFRPGTTVQTVASDLGRSTSWVYKSLDRIFRLLSGCVERSVMGVA